MTSIDLYTFTRVIDGIEYEGTVPARDFADAENVVQFEITGRVIADDEPLILRKKRSEIIQ